MTEPEPGFSPSPLAIIHAYECRTEGCANYKIEVRQDSIPIPWCRVCYVQLHDLGAAPLESEKPKPGQLITDEEEQKFQENTNPTYEDGVRHGKLAAGDQDSLDLRAQLVGYREIARERDTDANRAEQEVKGVETQRSELLRLLRDFDAHWIALKKESPDLTRAQEWLTRLSLIRENFKDVPAPNIVFAECTVHGKGSASGS